MDGFNAQKPGQLFGGRRVRSIHLAVGDFDALILGTSRTYALSTRHPFFGEERTYGAILRQTSMVELGLVFDYAVRHQRLQTVVIGLDFLTFSGRRGKVADFSLSGFAGYSPWWLLAKTLPNGQTLGLSFRTLGINRGFIAPSSESIAMEEMLGAYRDDARGAFKLQIKRFLVSPTLYGCYLYDRKRVSLLGQMIRVAQAEGIRVVLFISPVHALQLETMRALNLFGTFEQWKRDVTLVVGQRATLWDFSGYNRFTTEPLPEDKSPMRWYRESSHYREELGDLVLDRLADPGAGPADFGTQLTPGNVESHLRRIRRARERYASAHARELAMVRAITQESEPERRLRCDWR